jgi:hypothetical protein
VSQGLLACYIHHPHLLMLLGKPKPNQLRCNVQTCFFRQSLIDYIQPFAD